MIKSAWNFLQSTVAQKSTVRFVPVIISVTLVWTYCCGTWEKMIALYIKSFTHIGFNRYYWSATRGLEKRRFPTFLCNNMNAVPTRNHQSGLLYAVKSNWSLLNWPTTEFNKGLHSLFNSLEQCEPSYLKPDVPSCSFRSKTLKYLIKMQSSDHVTGANS